MIVTRENMYNFPSHQLIDVQCMKCGLLLNRKMSSIRSNIKANGIFICHNCKIHSGEYLKKHQNNVDKMKKVHHYYNVTCSICGKSYQLAHRTIRQLKGRPVVCKSCGIKKAHTDGKFDYMSLRSTSKVASQIGIQSDNYINAMKRLCCDDNHKQLMRQCGKIGSQIYHDNYMSSPSCLCNEIDSQINWIKTGEIFGVDKKSVPHNAKMIIRCSKCANECEINYKTIKNRKEKWECFACRRKLSYVSDLEKIGITNININTRGRITIKCQCCGVESERSVASVLEIYRSKKQYLCLKCAVNDAYNKTLEERTNNFLNKAARINPNYDYSKVTYINKRTNVTVICPEHGEFEVKAGAHTNNFVGCPKCSMSLFQKSLVDFIEHHGYLVTSNDRIRIHPYELDILIEQKNMAIECHGLYWHSYDHIESTSERNKHRHKRDLCAGSGIRLIQIFENEWRDKREIVESILKSKLGITNKIFARKCEIVLLDNRQHVEFMNANHIQGGKGCNVVYGLEYGNELVAVMSFNRHHKYEWEITRFANKLNTTVVGGASKLFKKFLKDNTPNTILTYADARYSNGNLYQQLGFEFQEMTKPNYYYIRNNKIHSRQQFQKHKLKNKLESFDPSFTEAENMFNNGYRRMWDAGHYRFIWSNQK